ncbi:MAG TPA: SpoIID/LytB domain-containing protein, partial [Bacillota bacterium]|nr:SpoIID/LytB domain-containing protein [Bacillota bacterium]
MLKSDNVTIDYVTLDFYCKHVLPAEWIAGWAGYAGGSNSLNAGAVALRTYAIGYINSPRGSTYDICATTSCQVYGATTSSYSDTAVNFTANYVEINSSGAIPSGLTEYSAENNQLGAACGDGFTAPTGGCLYDPVCAGEATYGHGRGMCQWGTARWATGNRMAGRLSSDTRSNGFPRRDWVWICRHYYPNLTLVKGAPLMVGDDLKALSTVNVRACTGGSITNGTGCGAVATKSAGATGTIIGGPTVVTNDGAGYTWYQVQWSDGAVGWSVENYLERVFPLPTAPASLSAAPAGTNQINLTWTDTASTESGFRIERSVAAAGPWLQINTVAAGSTTYADKNLPMGSTWFYRVRAYNAGGNSGYSTAAAATTANVPPVLGVIGNKTIFEGSTLLVTNTAIAPESVQLVTDFEPFMTETANGAVLFREPRNSASTSAFLDAAPNLAAITDVFSTAGNSSTRALRISCNFTNGNNPWLRLTTASAATFPNPIIDVAKQLRFSVYADKAIQVAVGCRETTTAAGTALGSDGGATGAIEWAGVTNLAGTAPMPTRTVNAGNWTTLTFNLPNEPILSCSGGNGVLATASGLAVLEHLAIVPAAGTGVYNVYLDNFAMVAP